MNCFSTFYHVSFLVTNITKIPVKCYFLERSIFHHISFSGVAQSHFKDLPLENATSFNIAYHFSIFVSEECQDFNIQVHLLPSVLQSFQSRLAASTSTNFKNEASEQWEFSLYKSWTKNQFILLMLNISFFILLKSNNHRMPRFTF